MQTKEKEEPKQEGQTFIIGYVGDKAGCGFYRFRALSTYINGINNVKYRFIEPPFEVNDDRILSKTAAIVFKSDASDFTLHLIDYYTKLRKRKKYKYNLVMDFDDLPFKAGDMGASDVLDDFTQTAVDRIVIFAKKMDLIIASTRFLADRLNEEGLGNVKVIPNVVSRYLFGYPTHKLNKKPLVCYTGSISHFGNRGAKVDFSEKWFNFVKNGVENDIFDFIIFGTAEMKFKFFGKKLGEKIGNIQWTHIFSYPSVLKAVNPDFIIAPLANVAFNKAKSNIKMLEAAALGAVFMGDVFDGSPYAGCLKCQAIEEDDTPKTIMEKFKLLKKPENFYAVQKEQARFITENELYTESQKYIGYYFNTLENKPTTRSKNGR